MNVRATLAAAVLGSLLCQAALAGPVIATKWRITGESRNECMGHAQEAIKRAGFESAGSGSESMMGRRGEYTAAVRCVTEQRFVFFVVSGPSPGEANQLLEMIYRSF